MPTKCNTACDDPLWCIHRKLCKKDAHPDRLSHSLMALRLEVPQSVADDHEAITRTREAALCDETFALVKAANEIHSALSRLFLLCAPECIPAENTLHLINQLDNAIAGYRSSLKAIINHWNEFGPEAGFDELLDTLARRIKLP